MSSASDAFPFTARVKRPVNIGMHIKPDQPHVCRPLDSCDRARRWVNPTERSRSTMGTSLASVSRHRSSNCANAQFLMWTPSERAEVLIITNWPRHWTTGPRRLAGPTRTKPPIKQTESVDRLWHVFGHVGSNMLGESHARVSN